MRSCSAQYAICVLISLCTIGALLFPLVGHSQDTPSELRVITYNLRSGRGYGAPDRLTTPERLARIGEAVGHYQPDVLVLQEPGPTSSNYDTLVAALGGSYRYRVLKCPTYEASNRVGLLVFRDTISVDSIDTCIQGEAPDADQLFNHWARVVLNVGGTPLVVYGFKLAPRDQSDKRRRQIDLLEPYLIEDLTQQRRVIVAADLNHRPTDPEYVRWKALGMVDSYDSLARGPGYTKMDELGSDPLVPYRRIDYLLLSPALASTMISPSRTLNEGEFIPALPHRPWSLSDHLPVMTAFRIP